MGALKDIYFPGFEKLKEKDFGGSLIRGNPREQRPISTRRPMHLVMRSELARGERSFLRAKRARRIRELIYRIGRKKGVKVYRFANSGNHLHLIVLPRSRKSFHEFIRAISGLIARISLGAERGSAKDTRFWDARPFTRILEWGRDFRAVCDYLRQNTLEAFGFIPLQPRERKERNRSQAPPGRVARTAGPARE